MLNIEFSKIVMSLLIWYAVCMPRTLTKVYLFASLAAGKAILTTKNLRNRRVAH